jgi:hypothetical protein
MKSLRLKFVAAALIGTASIIATCSFAQTAAAPTAPPAALAAPDAPLTAQQEDQLVAPVALYDDPLLVDVLTATTRPAEVVQAQRWISDPANAALKGDALSAALANQSWEPSVKSLAPFPQILNMMDSHLDWTEHLGDAFVVDQAGIMDAVQRLRHRAQSAGTLKSSPQQTVGSDGDFVTITPPATTVYVPAYDPWCAYGAWQVSAPYYYTSSPGYCTPDDDMISFDDGLDWPFDYWDWGGFDWFHHDIRINHDHWGQFHPGHEPAGDVWSHMPGGFGHGAGRDGFGGGGFAGGHFGGHGFAGGHFGGHGFGGGHGGGGGGGHR